MTRKKHIVGLVILLLLYIHIDAFSQTDNWVISVGAIAHFEEDTAYIECQSFYTRGLGVDCISGALTYSREDDKELSYYFDGIFLYNGRHEVIKTIDLFNTTALSSQPMALLVFDSIHYLFNVNTRFNNGNDIVMTSIRTSKDSGVDPTIISFEEVFAPGNFAHLTVMRSPYNRLTLISYNKESDELVFFEFSQKGLASTYRVSTSLVSDKNSRYSYGGIYINAKTDNIYVSLGFSRQSALYNFNSCTRTIEKLVSIDTSSSSLVHLSAAFSESGQFLYTAEANINTQSLKIYQYDLWSDAILDSKTLIETSIVYNFGIEFKRGIENRIYFFKGRRGNNIVGVINKPNLKGAAADIRMSTFEECLGTPCVRSMPNITLRAIEEVIDFYPDQIESCEGGELELPIVDCIDSIIWNTVTGEQIGGPSNMQSDTYIVASYRGAEAFYDTISILIDLNIVGNVDTSLCEGENLIINGVEYIEEGIYYDTIVGLCDSIVMITIKSKPEIQIEKELVFANIFSPNGDQINDHWNYSIPGNTTFVSLGIYDRWGKQVF